jgi:hypothetical protein
MTVTASRSRLDSHTVIGEPSLMVRSVIKRLVLPAVVAFALEFGYLSVSGRAGAGSFALIALGTCIALKVWSSSAIGLPLLPLLVVQNLVIYAVPIVTAHESIVAYPPDFLFAAGTEVLIFDVALIVAWKLGMQLLTPSRSPGYALHEFNRSGMRGWARLGFGMFICTTLVLLVQGSSMFYPVFASLPAGFDSVLNALLSVLSACGFFLVSMLIGGGQASLLGRAVFWVFLVANVMLSSSDFILSTSAGSLITVAIGFFWSNGRIPWRYLLVVLAALSFLNTGKTTMRARYWGDENAPGSSLTLSQLPAVYEEWAKVSFAAMTQSGPDTAWSEGEEKDPKKKVQTLLDRIDNMQNLLFVIDAIKTEHVSPLHGKTYTLIPPLLVPRFLWPDKPRSHEGQVLLNVHFGRQDLASTFVTYIAWGLLPEAYGNFGPVMGALLLGAVLGGFFAWVEKMTARKLMLSLEGFLSLSLIMNLMNSFEMVASVLVTSTFQSFVIIVAASAPFVRRSTAKRVEPGKA